jgi:hypothetical protein
MFRLFRYTIINIETIYRTLNTIQAHKKNVITEIWFIVILQQSSNFNIYIF